MINCEKDCPSERMKISIQTGDTDDIPEMDRICAACFKTQLQSAEAENERLTKKCTRLEKFFAYDKAEFENPFRKEIAALKAENDMLKSNLISMMNHEDLCPPFIGYETACPTGYIEPEDCGECRLDSIRGAISND